MKMLIVALALAGLVALPVLAQAQTDYGLSAPASLANQKNNPVIAILIFRATGIT
ncbi:MAG TPA: hypothetical protein VMF32_17925 [Xanthobacteraceae bacterium]|nr:hypothetical protein [Xanthobacteraceae bacterium]